MRIKLYVISTGKIINIQNVQLKYNRPGRVVVAFDCHKKYEEELWDEEVIFVNYKYKELFRGDMCRLSFLYYQADGHKPKVQFEIWDPYVKYGPVSEYYVSKFLTKKKVEEPVEEKEIPYLLTLHPQLRKVYEVMMAFKRRSRYYYNLYLMGLHILLHYIENNILPYDLLFPSPVKSTTIASKLRFKNESWEMTVLTPCKDLSSTLTFVGSLTNSVAEHESLDWAPVQDSQFWRTPTSAPVSCLKHKNIIEF